ncbi:MAG: hypothetical protein M1816_000716, partial [Peltula sp. TS41687]
MAWWKETEFGEKVAANDNPGFRNPNWLSTTRTAPAWAEFIQAAERTTGRPKLICRHCDEVLEHPNNRNSGSSGITAHLNRETCKKAARRRGQIQQRVQQTLKVPKSGRSAPRNEQFSQHAFEKQFLRSIVALSLPFRAANNQELRRLFTLLRPDITIPNNQRIRKILDQQTNEMEQSSLMELPEDSK